MNAPSTEFANALVSAVPRVRRFCYALTGSVGEADDLLQTTLEKALNKWRQFEPGTAMDRWLYRISRNQWVDNVRVRSQRGEHVDLDEANLPIADGDAVLTARMTITEVQTAMLALSENLRTVLYLVAVEGFSYRETAALLDIPEGTVMSRLARARAQLAESLAID